MKVWNFFGMLFMIFALASPWGFVHAQEASGPVYVVQEGDSLWDIAQRFRVSMDELAQVNGINDPSQLAVGMRLIIPGLEGIEGELTTRRVVFGEDLKSLSRRYRLPQELLVRLNHLSSPRELFVGASLVLPAMTQEELLPRQRGTLAPLQSLLELAILKGENPWTLLLENDLQGSWQALPGEVLYFSGEATDEGPASLPEVIQAVQLKPERFAQGKVAIIQVEGKTDLSLSGELLEHELHFFSASESAWISLQGIHAMTEPGAYPLLFSGTVNLGSPYPPLSFAFVQDVLIGSGNYPFDPVLTVSPETIDPAVTRPEDAQWAALADAYTPVRMWEGMFLSPVEALYSECWTSRFGNRRSYNGSAYIYFHSGLDFCGGVGNKIYAPAAGVVVFAGPLTVRGNATMIDHGWGIFTGYLHQSEIFVHVGDHVTAGQLIGLVGGTGRVSGPHLHWEVWAGGVQVDPMDWLLQVFP